MSDPHLRQLWSRPFERPNMIALLGSFEQLFKNVVRRVARLGIWVLFGVTFKG
jgi:hypothetical protein